MTEKTQEELAAEAAAAEQKAAAAAAKAEEKAAAKAAKEQAAAAAKAAKDAEKAEKAAAKLAAIEAKAQAKIAAAAAKVKAKEDAKLARESNRMPENNGVRRPKPETLCGKVWTLADTLSSQLGQAVPIAQLLEAAKTQGLNEGNVKTEYARWRKFNGVVGRIVLPAPAAAAPVAE